MQVAVLPRGCWCGAVQRAAPLALRIWALWCSPWHGPPR